MRQTLFKGMHNLKQLEKIIEVLGFPDDEDLEFIENEYSLSYLRRLPKTKPIKWEEKLPPGTNPLAIDLLRRMLRFSPDKRITIYDAISHPYF
jgi:mitogen-activated protein kinase 1/3